MIKIILIGIVILIILSLMENYPFAVIALVIVGIACGKGLLRKKKKCAHCGKQVPGPKQKRIGIGDDMFVLCRDCASKLHKQVLDSISNDWTYQDYLDALKWDEETKEERSKFSPDMSYSGKAKADAVLEVDTANMLFKVRYKDGDGEVFRFSDIKDYRLEFAAEEMHTGIITQDSVKGTEFIRVEIKVPKIMYEMRLCIDADYPVTKKGTLNPTYEYEKPKEFANISMVFLLCFLVANKTEREPGQNKPKPHANDIEKALALFMFDSADEVNEKTLKRQRAALMKTFHPDNGEENDDYAKKINAAYDILKDIAKRNDGA